MYHLSPMGQEMAQGREDADRTDGGTENSDRTAGGEEKVRESDTKRAKSFPVLAESRTTKDTSKADKPINVSNII